MAIREVIFIVGYKSSSSKLDNQRIRFRTHSDSHLVGKGRLCGSLIFCLEEGGVERKHLVWFWSNRREVRGCVS